jgi:hypothetical protein
VHHRTRLLQVFRGDGLYGCDVRARSLAVGLAVQGLGLPVRLR